MEVRMYIKTIPAVAKHFYFALLFILFSTYAGNAQPPIKKYGISKGAMQITLGKNLSEPELDEFIHQYDLENLAIKKLIRNNFSDSIKNLGWRIVINNQELLVITKPLFSADNLDNPAERIKMTDLNNPFFEDLFSSPIRNAVFGYNSFKNKSPFATRDSVVTFFLRNNRKAEKVLLAGNFSNWELDAIPMTKVDSGWITSLKLKPGKYLYKFIADGNWMVDTDNKNVENDGMGNDNSVFYFTNTVFRLDTFIHAKKIILSGSFNNWNEKELQMIRTGNGWQLPIFLAEGTYTYRYIVDGKWMRDPGNQHVLPNEFNDYNSVISIGTHHLFILPGYTDARQVFLAGSFNEWRNFELAMRKTPDGWRIPYTLGPGNYEFKFLVDRKWINAEGTQVKEDAPGSIFVIDPNYTFRLKGFESAKNVFLSGDFNNWSPNAYAMKKQGNEWILPVHLSPGKHLYKFVVDGKWITDPDNGLWEQNEHNTGNSVLWIEE